MSQGDFPLGVGGPPTPPAAAPAPTPAPTAERYDMLAVPKTYGGYANPAAFHAAVRDELGHLLGYDPGDPQAKLWFRDRLGNPGLVYVSLDGEENPVFPKDHPRFPGKDRLTWRRLDGGVLAGTHNDTARREFEARKAAREKLKP